MTAGSPGRRDWQSRIPRERNSKPQAGATSRPVVVSVVNDSPEREGDTMAAKFEISKDHAGKYRFHLKAPIGEIIAASQGYETKANAEKGIEAIKTHAPGAKVEDHTG
jgi:uncharacterized protein YegP (UPF0339 family)